MKKLFLKLLALWDLLRAMPLPLQMVEQLNIAHAANDELVKNHLKMHEDLQKAIAQRNEYERELRLMQMEPDRSAELLMQLRVHAMFERGSKGYGVTAFIPEAVLEKLRGSPETLVRQFTETIADNLVYRAIKGLWYRTSMNNVSVLVFDWRPEHRGEINAVCMESADQAPRIAAREPATRKIVPVKLPPEQLPPPSPKSGIWK